MPAYHYQCVECRENETRIGGVDDHVAICSRCGHLMLRLDNDLFAPYFDHGGPRVQVSGAKSRK